MDNGIKIGNYYYRKSTRKGKKLMTIVDGKKIHFGDISMQHYHDRTELLNKRLNHGDKLRRASFRARTRGIKKKDGSLAYKDPNTGSYHAYRILW